MALNTFFSQKLQKIAQRLGAGLIFKYTRSFTNSGPHFKNLRIFTNSEMKTEKKKNGLYPKIYANSPKFWDEATKTKGVYSKICLKTVLAHEFCGDNQYFGSLRPRIALQ